MALEENMTPKNVLLELACIAACFEAKWLQLEANQLHTSKQVTCGRVLTLSFFGRPLSFSNENQFTHDWMKPLRQNNSIILRSSQVLKIRHFKMETLW